MGKKIKYEPCPINEKDLCGDILLDDLFNEGQYVICPSCDREAIGYIDMIACMATYEYDRQVLNIRLLEADIHHKCEEAIYDYARMIETEEASRGLVVTVCHPIARIYEIYFYYKIEENEED